MALQTHPVHCFSPEFFSIGGCVFFGDLRHRVIVTNGIQVYSRIPPLTTPFRSSVGGPIPHRRYSEGGLFSRGGDRDPLLNPKLFPRPVPTKADSEREHEAR